MDFAAILVALVAVTGAIWAVDALVLAPRRRQVLAGEGVAAGRPEPRAPAIVEYARSFFPVFLVVLVLRSFVVEPFRIPSGSMMPTLLVGDFILVNKFEYGIRLPVVNTKVLEVGEPERGDVVVFRYPNDPSVPYIKRIVGLPGDHVVYRDHRLVINGEEVRQEPAGSYVLEYRGQRVAVAEKRLEHLGAVTHPILVVPGRRSPAVDVTVPPGHYFVLGDNRDNSRDSRYWGFVPEQNLVGHAFLIWMHWGGWERGIDFGRIGTTIH